VLANYVEIPLLKISCRIHIRVKRATLVTQAARWTARGYVVLWLKKVKQSHYKPGQALRVRRRLRLTDF
jgi:hypothetical protein